jgi:hypothetical protein
MRIKLLPSTAAQIAELMLNGLIPAQTSDYEVIEHLICQAKERGMELTFYREEADRSIDSEVMEDAIATSVDLRPVVELSMAQMEFACEQNIEMRPI